MTPAQSRHALGMTVNQFAAALGVNPVTVRRWEVSPDKASHRTPGAGTQAAIALLCRHDSRHRDIGLQNADEG